MQRFGSVRSLVPICSVKQKRLHSVSRVVIKVVPVSGFCSLVQRLKVTSE